jgi:hypothetical protein
VDEELVKRLKMRALEEGKTLREVAIEILGGSFGVAEEEWQKEPKPPVMLAGNEVDPEKFRPRLTYGIVHDPKTCRVYGCLMCEGKK